MKAGDIFTATGEPLLPLLDELLGFALLHLPMTRRPETLAHRGFLLRLLWSSYACLPTSSPQVISNCHPDWTKIVNPLPAATRTSATLTTRRIPNRSISAAANGAITPYKIRFTLTAVDMRVRGQPNSSCSGIIKTPGAARKPAAPSNATKATNATHQAGWIPVRGGDPVRGAPVGGGALVATSALGPRYGIAQ